MTKENINSHISFRWVIEARVGRNIKDIKLRKTSYTADGFSKECDIYATIGRHADIMKMLASRRPPSSTSTPASSDPFPQP